MGPRPEMKINTVARTKLGVYNYFSLVLHFRGNSGLLSYLHLTENGHKILVSTNHTKVALGTHKKFSLDYFGRMIANLLGVSFEKNISNTFENI